MGNSAPQAANAEDLDEASEGPDSALEAVTGLFDAADLATLSGIADCMMEDLEDEADTIGAADVITVMEYVDFGSKVRYNGDGVPKYLHHPPGHSRSVRPMFPHCDDPNPLRHGDLLEFKSHNITVVQKGFQVVCDETGDVVGKASSLETEGMRLSLRGKGIYSRTNLYHEECQGKGTGQGFSMFVHCAAALMVCETGPGIMEPTSGYDIDLAGLKVEIKGRNYATANSPANWVLGKYRLLSLTQKTTDEHIFNMKASLCEDLRNSSYLRGSSYDQGDSPYTAQLERLHAIIPKIDEIARDGLVDMQKHWLSIKTMEPQKPIPPGVDAAPLDAALVKGAKVKMGELLYPCPYRALCPVVDPRTMTQEQSVYRSKKQVRNSNLEYTVQGTREWNSESAGISTYHTLTASDDPTENLWLKLDTSPMRNTDVILGFNINFHQDLTSMSSHQSICIESELFGKIVGSFGCFYSIFSGVGICWRRPSRDSLLYDCNFYSFDPIRGEKLVGKWSSNEDYHMGPTFRLSRNDIHHAQTLPTRVMATVSSVFAMCDAAEYREIVPKLSFFIMVWHGSSWETSKYAEIARFFTCCHMAGTGNINAMIAKVSAVRNKFRFCDYLYLWKLKQYTLNPPEKNVTPLMQLPPKLLSLEKDIALGMAWHNRPGGGQETDCMKKIIKENLNEIKNRACVIEYYRKTADFLEKICKEGVEQSEYNDHMASHPGVPAMDFVYMIVCARVCRADLKRTADTQTSQGISIGAIASDRKCIGVLMVDDKPQHVTNGLVADELHGLLESIPEVTGFYNLFYQIASGVVGKVVNIFGIHAKDQKGSNRDISQQTIHMRPAQLASESLTNIYNNNVDDDMMNDRLKYMTITRDVSTFLKSSDNVKISSEDRSNFCGAQHIEAQSVVSLIVSIEMGSAAMLSAAAISRVDTKRVVVFPVGFDYSTLDEGLVVGSMTRQDHGNKSTVVRTLLMYTHMMQGIHACSAAMINTLFVSGTGKLQIERLVGLKNAYGKTTSDDCIRVVTSDTRYQKELVFNEALEFTTNNLHRGSMMPNVDKPIESSDWGEFNNLVLSVNGAVTQAPIHCSLAVQPLLGISVMTDIVTIVSSARSIILWGDPPDGASMALTVGLTMLQQKWLIDDEQLAGLHANKVIPNSIEELIEGFFIRDLVTFAQVYDCLDEDKKDLVEKGVLQFTAAVCSIVAVKPKRHRRNLMTVSHNLPSVQKKLRSIAAARSVSSRLNPRFAMNMPLAKRIEAKRLFLEIFTKGVEADEVVDIFEKLKPTKVSVHFAPYRRVDSLPTTMGDSASAPSVDPRKIRCMRFCKVSHGVMCADEELRISQLDEEDYDREMLCHDRGPDVSGISFKSPFGRPMTRIVDGTFFTRPTSFDFSVDVGHQPRVRAPFSFRGTIVKEPQPLIAGGYILGLCWDKGAHLCFAMGFVGSDRCAFYQTRDQVVHSYVLEESALQENFLDVDDHDMMVRLIIPIKEDWSPISMDMFSRKPTAVMAGVMGDETAILNMHGYLRSCHPGGFRNLQNAFMYSTCGMLPQDVLPLFPSFPRFREGFKSVDRRNLTMLKGSKSVGSLKLSMPGDRIEGVLSIDLSGPFPEVHGAGPVVVDSMY